MDVKFEPRAHFSWTYLHGQWMTSTFETPKTQYVLLHFIIVRGWETVTSSYSLKYQTFFIAKDQGFRDLIFYN